MAVAPGRGSGATGKGALETKGRRSPTAATSSRPVSCLPPPARPGLLWSWAAAFPSPSARSLPFFSRRPPTPHPPFREMSSLEGGFSPSSAPLRAGTVLSRAGKRASRAGRARGAPPAPERDPLPGAGAGEGARARDARRHRSARGPLVAAVQRGAECLPAPGTLSGRFLPFSPWTSDLSLSLRLQSLSVSDLRSLASHCLSV